MKNKSLLMVVALLVLFVGIAGAAVVVYDDGTKIDTTERIDFIGGPTVTKSGNKVLVTSTAYAGAVDFASTVDITGAATLDSTLQVDGAATLNNITILDVNDYSAGAGALPITKSVIALTTSGAEALTLADGVEGQLLTIKMVSDGGDGTVTPAHLLDGTTIVFDNTDSVQLIFLGTSWAVIGTPTATVS